MENIQNQIFTISELTTEIKMLLETSLPPVWVVGELSNFTHHSSGHMYFTLKDANAQISGVMWRSRNERLTFRPESGIRVKAYGSVQVYDKRGTYQFDCRKLEPDGLGDLQQQYDALKKKLFEYGWFDEQYKKDLPAIPSRIGIVSSATGAAIHDIINVIHRRLGHVQLYLRPTLVQGEQAAADIAQAIQEFNDFDRVDLLIVARGGGSLQDLWAFNEEIVAQAIFNSHIPVISAIGHEIDFTISDFVADYRAPTPSAAAEIAVPEKKVLMSTIAHHRNRCIRQIDIQLNNNFQKLLTLGKRYAFKKPLDLVRQYQQRTDDLVDRIESGFNYHLLQKQGSFQSAQKRIAALSPLSILKRGYGLVRNLSTGHLQTSTDQLEPGHELEIQFYKGAARTTVVQLENKSLEDTSQHDQ